MRKMAAIFGTVAMVAVTIVYVLVVAVPSAEVTAQNGSTPIPITAGQAFEAYADQVDPLTGEEKVVAIVDVRTTAEYYWVGTCAQVDTIITTGGREITPYKGKVQFWLGNRFLKFKVMKDSSPVLRILHISKVEEIITHPIAINIPYMTWDDANCEEVANPSYGDQIEGLADEGIEVIVLICRSGKRTSKPQGFDFDKFYAVYEVDQPDGTDGRGGFQGSGYYDSYNGYRGFPRRSTRFQDSPSVSWCDAGLPIYIGGCPE